MESRGELEHAVNGIVAKLTTDVSLFDTEARKHMAQRSALLTTIAAKEGQLREALSSEYEDIVVGGESSPPSQAARLLAGAADCDDWLPGPVARGSPAPLGEVELVELYRLTAEISAADEDSVRRGLPDPEALLSREDFAGLAGALQQGPIMKPAAPLWQPGTASSGHELERLRTLVATALEPFHAATHWELAAVEAGLRGGTHREPWDALVDLIGRAAAVYPALNALVLEHEVRLGQVGPLDAGLARAEEILAHVERGGGLGLVCPSGERRLEGVARFRAGVWKEPIDC